MKIFARTKRKADLNMSINAIVVLILAITMLGLGLGFIRTMFKGATSKLAGAVESASLKNPADSSNPLTIDRQIQVKAGSSERIEIGYYNSGVAEVTGVKLALTGCQGDAVLTVTDPFTLNTLASGAVKAGESTGYNGILAVKSGVPKGTYICQIATTPSGASTSDQSAQFFLEVTG